MGDERRGAVVVGGGPAGLVVASLLARAGHRVTVVDRGAPAPAGSLLLSGPALEVMQDLGWLDGLRGLPGVTTSTRLEISSERESVLLDVAPEMLVLGREQSLQEMGSRARTLGVEMVRGMTAVGLVWEGRRIVGVRVREGDGEEQSLRAAVLIDASGPSCWLATAVGQLLPRRGPRRMRVVASVPEGAPPEPALAARPGVGLLLLPGGHLVATAQWPEEGLPDARQLLETYAAALEPVHRVRLAGGTVVAGRVGTLPLAHAGEGWVAVGEAAGSGAPWLPGRTSTGLAVAATAAWEIELALRQRRPIGAGQLGATLTLTRQATRLELLADRALPRAAAVGLLAAAAGTPWRRRALTALLLGSWAPLRGSFGRLCYLWWLDLSTRRARAARSAARVDVC